MSQKQLITSFILIFQAICFLPYETCCFDHVDIETFAQFNTSGSGYLTPVKHNDLLCHNLKVKVKSLRSFSCVILYTEENCEGYSRKIEPLGRVDRLGVDYYFGLLSYQIKSLRACNFTSGGVFVDIYKGQRVEGNPIAKFENVVNCQDISNQVKTEEEISMDNYGNCVKIYVKPNCSGPFEVVPAGRHPLSNPLKVYITNQNGDIVVKNWQIKSFEFCQVPDIEIDTENKNNAKLVLILSITGSLIAIIIVLIISFLLWKIRKQSKQIQKLSQADVDEFLNGKPDKTEKSSGDKNANNYAQMMPYNQDYELASDELEVDTNAILGSGAFGIVFRGFLIKEQGRIRVAVKTVIENADISYLKSLLSELKVMIYIGSHANIVNLIGAQTKNIQSNQVYIALEFCDMGCLQDYLQNNMETFIDKFDSRQASMGVFNTYMLTKWACQVATGMKFLSEKNVIHADLAARNVLLTEDLTAKVSDFGLSRQLNNCAIYTKTKQAPLPWKWMAIESLQYYRFSVKSDVWSYGILLFEIYSLGQVPYPGCAYTTDFVEKVVEGTRPSKPQYASDAIYTVMKSCWEFRPEDRPTFSLICDTMLQLLDISSPYLTLQDTD